MMADWLLLPFAPAWAWPVSWAIVGAALVWGIWPRVPGTLPASVRHEAAPMSRVERRVMGPVWLPGCIAAVVAVLALWPHGGWSAYAALALQAPSLLSVTWALLLLSQALWIRTLPSHDRRTPMVAWLLLCALGWLLVIDTLDWWPHAWGVSWYAWGFSAGSLWLCACLVMALAWHRGGVWVWQSVALLLVYALFRWPSGNVWDAWLDPVVWIWAHIQVVRHAMQWLRQRG